MIVRSLLLRHGRLALPKAPTPSLSTLWRRTLVTETSHSAQLTSQPTSTLPQSASSQPTADLDPNDTTVADYEFYQHQKAHTTGLRASSTPFYQPHTLLLNPPRPQDITLELLLASQSHLGHATSLWNPANAAYIFGTRGDADPIHIISLDATAAHLRRACKVVSGVAARGGLILFVGTRTGQARCVVKAASLAQGCHLFDKWTPGTLTNAQQILGRCGKKVVDELDRSVPGFEPQLAHNAAVKPDLVVCLNPVENYTLLHECGMHNIPTIGIIDTDANPAWVTYPIPANDDSLRCVQVIAGALGRAGEEGQAKRLARAQQGFVDYEPSHGLSPPTREEIEASKRGDEGSLAQNEDEEDVEDIEEEGEGDEEPDAYALRQAELEKAKMELEGAASGKERDAALAGLTGFEDEVRAEGEDVVGLSREELGMLADRAMNEVDEVDHVEGEKKEGQGEGEK